MGFSYHKTEDDYFITINGKPFTDYNPADVSALINSLPKEERELVKAIIKNKPIDKYEELDMIKIIFIGGKIGLAYFYTLIAVFMVIPLHVE